MILYQSVGPNPRVVLMYLAETGVEVQHQFVDIMAGENRQGAFAQKSPLAHTPLLELDSGECIAESLAICEYLDEVAGQHRLMGASAEQRARTHMLMRIVDQSVVVPMTTAFRGAEGLAMFQTRLLCLPNAADDLKRLTADGLVLMDRLIGEGPWLAGDRFSLADILLYSFVEFGAAVGQPADPSLTHLAAWRARAAQRPSAAASANPRYAMGES